MAETAETAAEETSSGSSGWRQLWDNEASLSKSTVKPTFELPSHLEISLHSDFPSVEEYLSHITDFLDENYVEDEDGMFRFSYKPEHIKWAMIQSLENLDLLVSLRTIDTKMIVAFIAACPCNVNIHGELSSSAIIDFVCVHKEHRGMRLCPLLYSIIHSKLYERGILTALKTTGTDISFPITKIRYSHKLLNGERLFFIQFTPNLQVTPKIPPHPELSVLCESDLSEAFNLLNNNNKKFSLAQQFLNPSHLGHVLLPQDDLVFTLVKRSQPIKGGDVSSYPSSSNENLESSSSSSSSSSSGIIEENNEKIMDNNQNDIVTDLVSVYFVKNKILIEVANTMSYEALINGIASEAQKLGADVLNILPMGEITELTCRRVRAVPGTGCLGYYAYNFDNLCSPMTPSEVFVFPAI